MYRILQKKKQITLEDILAQFEVAPSTAYNVQRVLRSLCERHPEECEVQVRNRRTVLVWTKEPQQGEEEIRKILDAKPERPEIER